MEKVLAVYGAGGLGREVLELAKIINGREKRWDGFIFIDDGVGIPPLVNGIKVYDYPGTVRQFKGIAEVAMGVGEPAIREMLFSKLKRDGMSLAALIHPDVYVPENTHVGEGVIIQMGCFISCNVTISDYVYIQPHVNVGHDCVLEEGCMAAGFCNISGAVHVGKYSYLASSTCIKQGISIGDNCVVGMGAVVFRDVKDNMIVLGNPAKVISRNDRRRVF